MGSQSAHLLEEREETPGDKRQLNCAQLEGLATAARVLEADDLGAKTIVQRLRGLIDPAMTEVRTLQIMPNQHRMDLKDGSFLWSPKLRDYAGAFLGGPTNPETRIDYTGHCLSTMMILDRP